MTIPFYKIVPRLSQVRRVQRKKLETAILNIERVTIKNVSLHRKHGEIDIQRQVNVNVNVKFKETKKSDMIKKHMSTEVKVKVKVKWTDKQSIHNAVNVNITSTSHLSRHDMT